MKCPYCKTEIDKVIFESKCWQEGYLDGDTNMVTEFGSVEEVGETLFVTCPNCDESIIDVVDLGGD